MTSNDKADYESLFLLSWDKVENSYKRVIENGNVSKATLIYSRYALAFIDEVRHHEYSNKLRAGTQFMRLILSRSKKNGLRTEQSHIRVDFHQSKLQFYWLEYIGDRITTTPHLFESLKLTYDVRTILNWLVARPLD